MKLKKLIISGFKSFADKVVLTFDDGITGIVGPNGSGKSNVIDAVRWVMGEQSAKHLRGQVATDIIFAGSDKRKALGMAEVTLIFENSDFSDIAPPEYRSDPEIAITRRMYADGAREYMIQKKPCRFKDLTGFFTSTGLGGRSYSMIQQGQVDRILNAKPEDVREILEEAAGTTIYRNRRDAAQKKLNGTHENLSRIEDIVAELARQLAGLEGQVEKAKRWKELSEELETKEINLLAHNFHDFNKRLVEAEQEVGSQDDAEAALITQIADAEANLVTLQQKLAEADPELEQVRERVATARETIARVESQISNVFVTIENGEQRLVELESQTKEDQEDLESTQRLVDQAEREISLAQEEALRLEDELEVIQDSLEQADESAQVFRNREDEVKDELKNLQVLLETNAVRSEAIERDRMKTSSDLEAIVGRLESLGGEIVSAESELQQGNTELESMQDLVKEEIQEKLSREELVAEIGQNIDSAQRELGAAREQVVSLDARKTSLAEIIDAFKDSGDLFDRLENERPEALESVVGVLNRMIRLRDSEELPEAVLSSFDSWADRFIVSESSQIYLLAESLLALEDEQSACSCSVVVDLNFETLQLWAQSVGARSLEPYLSYEDLTSLKNVVSRLFWLPNDAVSNLDWSGIPPEVVLFVENGLAVTSKFDVVVASDSNGGILARKSEIDSLGQSARKHEQIVEQLTTKMDELRRGREHAVNDLREVEQRLESKNENVLNALKNKQAAQQSVDHLTSLVRETKERERYLRSSLAMFSSELEELGQARISYGSERENLEFEVGNMKDEAFDVIERSEEVRRQFDGKKMELAQAKAKVAALTDASKSNSDQLERRRSAVARRSEERGRIEKDIDVSREKESKLAIEIQDWIVQREEWESKLEARRQHNAELIQEIKTLEDGLKQSRTEHGRIQKLKSNKGLELERVRIALEGVTEQAIEKYQIDIANHEIELDKNFDSSKASKEIQYAKSQIDGLGNINMMAIEEYEKLSERYEFIRGQREEVLGSMRILEEAISEIEETAKERFLETFVQINENFGDLFPILFPGGDAHLHLTEPEDPLKGGVEILVRLPGKKQRSMTLFSGGEKALTAISLIFALLKTKPTPFCFLDEVDAPLDEANVGRYNKVLEFLSQKFQFVVITHNRRTMEVLDQLYGVTMQEGGVSKVVGVDMKKDLPKHLQKSFEKKA